MKSFFAKQAANTNTPKPIEHLHSEERVVDGLNLGELLGLDDDGNPISDVIEMEFDEPHAVSFQADTQIPNTGTYRMYVMFDAESKGVTGERMVLIAHDMTKEQVENTFETWATTDSVDKTLDTHIEGSTPWPSDPLID